MEAALGVTDIVHFEDALDREHGRHSRLSFYREHFPEEYRRYFKNPWDRLVSSFSNRAGELSNLEAAGLSGKAARKRLRSAL